MIIMKNLLENTDTRQILSIIDQNKLIVIIYVVNANIITKYGLF